MAKQTAHRGSALKFLVSPADIPRKNVYTLFGGDAFLKRETRKVLLDQLFGTSNDDLGAVVLEGKTAEMRDVADALSERSLFGDSQQVVIVEDADPFVKRFREQLETLVSRPIQNAVLVLEVDSWPGNTRLAKMVSQSGMAISCNVPQQGRELTEFTKQLKDWLIHVADLELRTILKRPAADLLVDLLPVEPGILYQEVNRLALLAPEGTPLSVELVRQHVGGWRTQKTWDMIDAAAEGRAADALEQLSRLLSAGEDPHALLPQLASTFRRFAAAARIYEQAEGSGRPTSLRAALEESGMPPFKLRSAEAQLKQIGRQRAKQIYGWLLAADLALKGHNSTKDRARRELEILIIRLARQASGAA